MTRDPKFEVGFSLSIFTDPEHTVRVKWRHQTEDDPHSKVVGVSFLIGDASDLPEPPPGVSDDDAPFTGDAPLPMGDDLDYAQTSGWDGDD